MKKEYQEALAEVNVILENTEEELINKIPNNFKKLIKDNMDNTHKIELQSDKELTEQNIKKETKQILALIYRDYLCTKEEKRKLILQEQKEREKLEEEKREKYNIDLRKIANSRKRNNIIEKSEKKNGTELIKLLEEKWYQKIIYKILKIFKLK